MGASVLSSVHCNDLLHRNIGQRVQPLRYEVCRTGRALRSSLGKKCRGITGILAATDIQRGEFSDYKDEYEDVEIGGHLPEGYDYVGSAPPKNRRAGVILHPTSLPGPFGCGEIGSEAYKFIDWLVEAGMQLWQVLPLVPPEREYWSPYSGLDALCGNTLLIPLHGLVDLGLLKESELPDLIMGLKSDHAEFPVVYEAKIPLLDVAARRLLHDSEFGNLRKAMNQFRSSNPWVEDSAMFYVLTEQPDLKGIAWWDWPAPIRLREPKAIAALRIEHEEDINVFIALQYLFDRFWREIKNYANQKGISIVGDMPIYVGGQSADVWANQSLFELGADGAPVLVSGVPPDAFSDTGQLWGSPLYDWNAQAADGYKWWVQRFRRSLDVYDETRVDHFRAFTGYWAVEAWRENAMIGTWKKGPGIGIFEELKRALGSVPILAEDLGVITKDVIALRIAIGAPGMQVLQFAWGGGSDNTHLPHNSSTNCFVYPGTHDNQTTVGWWQQGATDDEKKLIRLYLGMGNDDEDVVGAFLRASYTSVARTTVVTMQDVLRLDDSARMNTPGKAEGNWTWRLTHDWDQLKSIAAELRDLANITDRLPKHNSR